MSEPEADSIRIRWSEPQEAARLADIWRRSVRATHDFLREEDFRDIDILVREHYLPQTRVWVIDVDDAPAGFMGLSGAHVDALFIDPGRRARGLGRALLDHAARLAGPLTVDVNEQNALAVGFYERMGFRRSGRSPHDDAGRPYPLLHLRQD
ncbi:MULTISPECIES: acetyltransferase [unclassified Massilia]|uniref:acetyltransferase n=1 Tax=unclassified Massilia TaxID=2609279 RepID=UPI001B8454D7|nr:MULTISPECIES: acetyltransferase [unclassified Massilia]MBQ5940528.1 acetyltransferase [Massilia sp. AB1]MBQ5965130.1 acetyltransferase [Massilia sp. ZL223]